MKTAKKINQRRRMWYFHQEESRVLDMTKVLRHRRKG